MSCYLFLRKREETASNASPRLYRIGRMIFLFLILVGFDLSAYFRPFRVFDLQWQF